jgi:hypothetical protein
MSEKSYKYKVICRKNYVVELGTFNSSQEAWDFVDDRCKDWNYNRWDFDVMTIPVSKQQYKDNTPVNLKVFLK